jgi:transposase
VSASDALAHRAYEEARPFTPPARELINNYFRAQKLLSSGVVEGLNNKAKVTMRKSYGFRTFPLPRTYDLSLTWQITQPESTHDFF